MKICHICNAECEADAQLCHVCGAELREEIENEQISEKELENPVLAVSVEDVVTAEIYRDMLNENGILFMCDSKEQGNMKVLFGGGFIAEDIYVSERDLERAKEIYQEVLSSENCFEDFGEDTYEE